MLARNAVHAGFTIPTAGASLTRSGAVTSTAFGWLWLLKRHNVSQYLRRERQPQNQNDDRASTNYFRH